MFTIACVGGVGSCVWRVFVVVLWGAAVWWCRWEDNHEGI